MKEQMLDDLAEEMYEIVHEIIKKYQFRDRNRICCYDITVSQCYVLYELKKESLTMRNLASRLYLDISTMSRVVDQLQKKNYIIREQDASDRRITHVSLTEQGERLLGRIETDLVATEKEILRQISPAARHSVLFVLRELANSVNNWQKTCCNVPVKIDKMAKILPAGRKT